jgi:hypothetical protein
VRPRQPFASGPAGRRRRRAAARRRRALTWRTGAAGRNSGPRGARTGRTPNPRCPHGLPRDLEHFLDRLGAEGATSTRSSPTCGASAPAAPSTSTSSSPTRRRWCCCARR